MPSRVCLVRSTMSLLFARFVPFRCRFLVVCACSVLFWDVNGEGKGISEQSVRTLWLLCGACAFSRSTCVCILCITVCPLQPLRHFVVLRNIPSVGIVCLFLWKTCACLPDIVFFFWCLRYAEDFVAHAGNVNCIAIGRRTAKIVATGGDDCAVNIWGTGKPNCLHVRSCPTDCCLSRPHPALHVPRLYGVADGMLFGWKFGVYIFI